MSDRYWPLIFIFVLIGGMLAAGAYLILVGNGSDEPEPEEVQQIETVQPTIPPTLPPSSPTPTAVLNRLDCDSIRGTEYISSDERTWFLANCVTRTSCAEIEGTDFRTAEERVWYQANCVPATATPDST